MGSDGTTTETEKTHILWATNMDDEGYADVLFLVGDKPPFGVGINCGGHVIVKPLREWHRLASVVNAEERTNT